MPASPQRKLRRAWAKHTDFMLTYPPRTLHGPADMWILTPRQEPIVVCMRMRLCGLDRKYPDIYASWKGLHDLSTRISASTPKAAMGSKDFPDYRAP